MRRLYLGLLSTAAAVIGLGVWLAHAQVVTNPAPVGIAGAYNSAAPTCTSGAFCWVQLDVNGNLKTVSSGTPSGTQDVNLKQYNGSTVGATNAQYVQPGTGATWAATQSGTWTVQPGNTANTTPWLVTATPSSASGAAVAPVSSSALAANTVIKASAGNLYSFQVSADSTLSAAAWWIMIFDATSAPGDGAVTPAKCYAMPAGVTSASYSFAVPVRFATGITIGVGTTGCFTKTASTHAFISGDAQ